jgi:hypothetical protein
MECIPSAFDKFAAYYTVATLAVLAFYYFVDFLFWGYRKFIKPKE